MSMYPLFNNNDYIVAMNWLFMRFRPGQAVLVSHPSLGLIIKRIVTVESNHYKLVGDHSYSISSEKMGWIKRAQIIGRVIFRIPSHHDDL